MNSDMIIQWVLSQSPAVKTLSLISPLALVYEPRLKFSIDTMLTPLAAAVQGPINSLTEILGRNSLPTHPSGDAKTGWIQGRSWIENQVSDMMISFIGRGPLPFEGKEAFSDSRFRTSNCLWAEEKKKEASAADINSAALTFNNHIALLWIWKIARFFNVNPMYLIVLQG